ncbi:MAG TPA: hypothetical protein VLE19_01030 [Pyrinomonadaceae bacterium]|nr:hypothetical protein [Pyrinomonadaceae bacterium]
MAAGGVCVERRARRLAMLAGANEHACPFDTGLSVRLLPFFLPLSETIDEGAALPSPSCNATAVYPRVVDATIRPDLPSAVVN